METYHRILWEKGDPEKGNYIIKHLFVERIGNIAWGVFTVLSQFDDGSGGSDLKLLYTSEDKNEVIGYAVMYKGKAKRN